METFVKIEWDIPDDKNWLCPENIETALSAYCTNTKFKVTDLTFRGKIDEVIICGDKLYYDLNPNSKMVDVPSHFYEMLEGVYDKWSAQKENILFYDYCLKMYGIKKDKESVGKH